MKPITAIRGAVSVCFGTLVCVFQTASAVAATGSAAARTTTTSFEQTPLNLPKQTTTHVSTTSFGATMVRTLIGLLIVVAVIYALTWVLRKTKAAGTGNAETGSGLEQVASLPLGTNRALTLVRVGDELHLLGVAEHSVSELRTYSEEEAYELGIPFNAEQRAAFGSETKMTNALEAIKRWTVR